MVMGSAWAVFLARTCLEASFEALRAPTITYGKPTPSFQCLTSSTRLPWQQGDPPPSATEAVADETADPSLRSPTTSARPSLQQGGLPPSAAEAVEDETAEDVGVKLILMLYIDDYIGFTLKGPGEEEEVLRDKEEVKQLLNGKGLAIHKEDWGEGLSAGVGLTIPAARPYVLRVQSKKLAELILATEALILEEVALPSVMASLVGHWTWTMMVFRPSFAILDETRPTGGFGTTRWTKRSCRGRCRR